MLGRILSRGCVRAITAQAPFGDNELCHFHIGQRVRIGAEEPKSRSLSTQSERVNMCISKPITKTLWITLGIHEFKRENGSLPVVLHHSKTPFLKHPNTPLMTQVVTFPPQSSLHYCMYLTVCLSSSEDLICALNMSL